MVPFLLKGKEVKGEKRTPSLPFLSWEDSFLSYGALTPGQRWAVRTPRWLAWLLICDSKGCLLSLGDSDPSCPHRSPPRVPGLNGRSTQSGFQGQPFLQPDVGSCTDFHPFLQHTCICKANVLNAKDEETSKTRGSRIGHSPAAEAGSYPSLPSLFSIVPAIPHRRGLAKPAMDEWGPCPSQTLGPGKGNR